MDKMDNFTVENVLIDIATGLPAGVMECDIPEYDIVMDENDNFVMGDKMTLIAPNGQRFIVTVTEEK